THEEKDPLDKNVDSEEQAAERPQPRPGVERPPTNVEVKIDFERIGRRARRLTRTPDTITSLTVSPEGRTAYFVTSGTEGGQPVQSIWSMALDGERPTRVSQSVRPAA